MGHRLAMVGRRGRVVNRRHPNATRERRRSSGQIGHLLRQHRGAGSRLPAGVLGAIPPSRARATATGTQPIRPRSAIAAGA